MSQRHTQISLSRSALSTALLLPSHREFSLIQSTALTVPSQLPVVPSPSSTAHSSGHTGPFVTLDSAAVNSTQLGRMRCLPRGELGHFSDAGWDLSLGACVSQHLRPRGTLAQGDCGPDSASMCMLGEAATPVDAVTMRVEVLQVYAE